MEKKEQKTMAAPSGGQRRPFFKVGSLLLVKLVALRPASGIMRANVDNSHFVQDVVGICLKKKNKGFNSTFVLLPTPLGRGVRAASRKKRIKSLLPSSRDGSGAIQKFPLYSPFIKKITVLSFAAPKGRQKG